MISIPNIQQDFDNHLFDSINNRFGNGDIAQSFDAEQNKYAVIREYRTVDPTEVIELVRGRTNTNTGAIIIGNTRVLYTPIQINGKRYTARLETFIYLTAVNLLQSQIGGDRTVYKMTKDVSETLINLPITINRLTIPITLQTLDSEFSTTELDASRLLCILPISQLQNS